jgi:hypothetical protein
VDVRRLPPGEGANVWSRVPVGASPLTSAVVARPCSRGHRRARIRFPISETLLASLLLLCGCAQDNDRDEITAFELEHVRALVWGVRDTVLAFPAELTVAGGTILLGDEMGPDVRMVDFQTGELIRRIGGRGEGPGELRGISGLATAAGRIVVADPRNQRVTTFDFDGRLVSEITHPAARIGAIELDALGRLHLAHRGRVGSATAVAAVHDTAGRPLASYANIYEPMADPFGDALNNEARFARTSDGMWVLIPYRGLLLKVTPEGELVTQLNLQSDPSLPMSGPFTERGEDGRYSIVRMPVALDIASGENGSVYALSYASRGGRFISIVSVYGPTGRQLGSYELAHRATRIAVHDNLLLALRAQGGALPGIDFYRLPGEVAAACRAAAPGRAKPTKKPDERG